EEERGSLNLERGILGVGIFDDPHRPIANLKLSRFHLDRARRKALVEAKSYAAYDRVRLAFDVGQERDFALKMCRKGGPAAMLVAELLFRILGPEFFHRMKGRPNVPDIAAIDIKQLVDLEPSDDSPRMAVGIVRLVWIGDE